MELLRQADWAQEPVQLFRYRDKQQREVDVILERHSGEIVGIGVKASATPNSRDLGGLRYLRDKLGARFKAGVVLHAGADTRSRSAIASLPCQSAGCGSDAVLTSIRVRHVEEFIRH
jgi:predicted AAA+ superfamily ATPase